MVQGGALIGQGAFGCVFDTLPSCSKRSRTIKSGRFSAEKRQTRRVAKILRADSPAAKHEIDNSKYLSRLPNYDDYFVLIEDFCVTNDITSDPDWETCSLLNPGQRRQPTFVQLRMSYGGIRLSEYARDLDHLLENWVAIQIHVAEAVQMLHNRGWVHGDLHFGNILVDTKNVARLTDFGLSYHIKEIKEKDVINLTFLPKYDNYAPELDYVAGIRKGLTSREAIDSIFNNKSILDEIDEMFPSIKTAKQKFEQFASLNTPRSNSEVVDYLVKYVRASDIWCLGFDLFSLYKLMISNEEILSSWFYRKHHRTQMGILEGLLHPDPRRRFNAEQLLTELYTLRMDSV